MKIIKEFLKSINKKNFVLYIMYNLFIIITFIDNENRFTENNKLFISNLQANYLELFDLLSIDLTLPH